MIDVNKPVTNPELVDSMNKFLNERSAENEGVLIEKITKAHYLAPIILQGEIENGILKAGSTISFKMLTNSLGETFFMAFTDWDELAKWSTEKEETLISTYDDLKSMVLKDTENVKGFVINPYGQNIVITPELMQYFSQSKSEVPVTPVDPRNSRDEQNQHQKHNSGVDSAQERYGGFIKPETFGKIRRKI